MGASEKGEEDGGSEQMEEMWVAVSEGVIKGWGVWPKWR